MSVPHNLTLAFTRNGETLSSPVTLMVTGEAGADVAVTAGATAFAVAIAFTVANVQDIYISSDQNITIHTNNSTTPIDTVPVTAGNPILWYSGSGQNCPFAHDVTHMYIANAASVAANVKIRTGSNANV